MWLAGLAAPGSASADNHKHADKAGEVDTEHMFGFTEGSDIGEAGEKELEVDSTGRFGKLDGSYNNVATALEAKYSFSDRFRLSAVATVAYYDIAGVSSHPSAVRGAWPQQFRRAGVLHRPDFLRDLRPRIFPLGGMERAGLGRGGGKLGRARSGQFRAASSEAARRRCLLSKVLVPSMELFV
jgi:hypothetical protein